MYPVVFVLNKDNALAGSIRHEFERACSYGSCLAVIVTFGNDSRCEVAHKLCAWRLKSDLNAAVRSDRNVLDGIEFAYESCVVLGIEKSCCTLERIDNVSCIKIGTVVELNTISDRECIYRCV